MGFNYKRPTFTLDGIRFRFKKSSPKNSQAVLDYYEDLIDEYGGKMEDVREDEADMEDFQQQNIESMKDMVRLVADPVDHDDIETAFDEVDFMQVDQKKVQEAMNYFLG